MKLALAFAALIVSGLVHAQEMPNLFAQKAARDQAVATQARNERMSSTQQRLLIGMQRLPSGLNSATAQCSDGWNNGDFENKVAEVCNAKGCFSYYSRDPQRAYGFIFTCNFYLNNGSQCHAEAFSSPRNGYSVHCVMPNLQNMPRKLIYTDN